MGTIFNSMRLILSGKKSMACSLVAIISMGWGLLSPTTAPDQEAIQRSVDQGQVVFQSTKGWLEEGRRNVLPFYVAFGSSVLGLFANMAGAAKFLNSLRIIGGLVSKYIDPSDIHDPQKFLAEHGPSLQPGIGDPGPEKGAGAIQAALKAKPIAESSLAG